jgi:hypothetical protein
LPVFVIPVVGLAVFWAIDPVQRLRDLERTVIGLDLSDAPTVNNLRVRINRFPPIGEIVVSSPLNNPPYGKYLVWGN